MSFSHHAWSLLCPNGVYSPRRLRATCARSSSYPRSLLDENVVVNICTRKTNSVKTWPRFANARRKHTLIVMKSKNPKWFTLWLIRIRRLKRPFSGRQTTTWNRTDSTVGEDRTLLISRKRIRQKLNCSIDFDFSLEKRSVSTWINLLRRSC